MSVLMAVSAIALLVLVAHTEAQYYVPGASVNYYQQTPDLIPPNMMIMQVPTLPSTKQSV